MRVVSFEELLLWGFGPYSRGVRLRLRPGCNVLVAPNETGKSTLVSGFSAVLFGLDDGADPSRFSQARFRNWDQPGRFAGQLTFTVGGRRFRLRRDFSAHHVVLARQEGEGWRKLFAGEHLPAFGRGGLEYEKRLQELIGVTDRQAFEAVFCVVQPLPDGRTLNKTAQRLITGTAEAGCQAALRRLAEASRRYVGGRPLDAAEGGELEGEIERLRAEIEELNRAIPEALQAVDGLRQAQREREEVRKELDQTEKAHLQRRAALEAWHAWREHVRVYEAARQDAVRLARALGRLRSLLVEIEAAEERLESELAPFVLGEEALEKLEELVGMIERQEELQAERQRRLAGMQEEETAINLLQGELDDLQEGEPPPESGCRRPWGRLAQDPAPWLYNLRVRLDEGAIEDWRAFVAGRRRLTELNRALREELAGVEAAAAADEDFVQRHAEESRRLAERLSRAEARMEAAERAARAFAIINRARKGRLRAWKGLAAGAAVGAALAWGLLPDPAAWLALAGATLAGLLAGILSAGRSVRRQEGIALKLRSEARQHDPAEYEAAQIELEEARLALERHERQFTDEDGLDLLAAWQQARAELARLSAEVERYADRIAPELTVDEVESMPAQRAGSVWMDAARLYAFLEPAEEGRRLRELVAWVEKIGPEEWSLWQQEAEAWEAYREKIRQDLAARRAKLASLRSLDKEEAERLKALSGRIETARQALDEPIQAGKGDPRLALRQARQARRLDEEVRHRRSSVEEVLQAVSAEDVDALQDRLAEAEFRVRRARDEMEKLRVLHPELPGDDVDGAELAEAHQRLEDEVGGLQRRIDALSARERELLRQEALLQGKRAVNIAEAEQRRFELKQRLDAALEEAEAIRMAHETLEEAVRLFQEGHRGRLGEAATGYFAAMSNAPGRRVAFDDDLTVRVFTEGGVEAAHEQLSQGARDQLYLSVRLSVADLLAAETTLPFLFDDPFLNFDAERTRSLREVLNRLGETRQILLLTHREELAGWGRRVEPEILDVQSGEEIDG